MLDVFAPEATVQEPVVDSGLPAGDTAAARGFVSQGGMDLCPGWSGFVTKHAFEFPVNKSIVRKYLNPFNFARATF